MHEQTHSEGRKMRHREVDHLSRAPLVHRLLSSCKGTIKWPDELKPNAASVSILGCVGGAGAAGTRARSLCPAGHLQPHR